MGNLKIKRDGADPTRAALVSTKGGLLRVSLLTLGQTLGATTTDFASLFAGTVNPFVRLRVESVYFYGGDLSVTLTAWQSSGNPQGLIFRLTVTGAAVARNTNYGTGGLWLSTPAYPNYRAVRECSNVLVGIADHKLVAMGVRPDGQELEPSFGVGGIAEFDMGGKLDRAIAGQDRFGWIYFFAQRQSDSATVGARLRVNTPLNPVPNGTLDPAFGTNGLVTLKVDGYSTAPGGFTLHDDTILDVALSRMINASDTISALGIARLKLDGTLDAGFGSAGVARHGGMTSAFAFGSDGSSVYAMTRESDNVTTVVWLDANGKFKRAVSFPPQVPPVPDSVKPYLRAESVQIHPDGSTWVSGLGSSGLGSLAWVVRLTAAGNLDQTFGTGGVVHLRENEGQSGSALLKGWRANGGGIVKVLTHLGTYLCGLSSSGQLDQTFAQGGYVTLPVNGSGYLMRPDGSVLFPTAAGAYNSNSFGLLRVTSTGTVDPNFGVGNSPSTAPLSRRIVLTVPSPGSRINLWAATIAAIVEKGGKLYAIGTTGTGGVVRVGLPTTPAYGFIMITRWNQDGTVDTTYGNGGAVFYGEDGGDYLDWTCGAVAAEPGEPITLAGSAAGRPAIWQLNDSGVLDTGFGPGGLCSVLLQEVTTDRAFAIAVLPGGKVRIGCSTGLVQFVLTSPKSIPQRILEIVLKQLATLLGVFSKKWSERLRQIKV